MSKRTQLFFCSEYWIKTEKKIQSDIYKYQNNQDEGKAITDWKVI